MSELRAHYYSVAEVARRYDVDDSTVRRAIQRGDLKAYRIGPRGPWRILHDEAETWARGATA